MGKEAQREGGDASHHEREVTKPDGAQVDCATRRREIVASIRLLTLARFFWYRKTPLTPFVKVKA